MKILIYGINYHPELTGIGKYTTEMCEWFAERNFSVTVITANPYYPEWAIRVGYRNWFSREVINKVTVHRCPIYVPTKVTGLSRILHEISFILSSSFLWVRMLFQSKFDVVICISPPFHSGIFGIVYRFLKGSKLVYHIQDLQVDAASQLKLVRSKNLLDVLRLIEKSIMSRSDLVSTISSGMASKIRDKVNILKTVNITPNWVDINFIKPSADIGLFRDEFGFDSSDFVILYSGNLGEKQGLDIIIEAARVLRKNLKMKFLICGSGAYKNEMLKLAAGYHLENVFFVELQPYTSLPTLLNTADVHLILQKRATADLVLPSKLSGIASSGGYSIVTADPGTTLFKVIRDHKIGTVIPPEDLDSLVKAITDSAGVNLEEYRKNARKYAETHLNKDVILQSFLDKLKKLNGKEGVDHRNNGARRSISK